MIGVVDGSIQASYPKTIGPVNLASNWNVDAGTRRSFTVSDFPRFTDTVSAWANPAKPGGYSFQIRLRGWCELHTVNYTHYWDITINAVSQLNINSGYCAAGNTSCDNPDTGFVTCAYASTGTMAFRDGFDGGGTSGTAHTENVYIDYQFSRA